VTFRLYEGDMLVPALVEEVGNNKLIVERLRFIPVEQCKTCKRFSYSLHVKECHFIGCPMHKWRRRYLPDEKEIPA
jgi:hypothetical protein